MGATRRVKARKSDAPPTFGEQKRLTRAFYRRPVLKVARDILGKILAHETPEGTLAGRIVEVEAYRGPEDLAAHSRKGRRTARTEVMFGPAGHAYLFFVYGMHWNFNVVTGKTGEPHAILVRAVEPLEGHELMARRRQMPPDRVELTNGPGKLCQAFAITGQQYGADLCTSALTVLDGPRCPARRSARIGVDYAGAWADKPWRFFDPDSPFVSRPRTARGTR